MRVIIIIFVCIFCFVGGMTYQSVDAGTNEKEEAIVEETLWEYEKEEEATVFHENNHFLYYVTGFLENVFDFLTTKLVDFLYHFTSLFFR